MNQLRPCGLAALAALAVSVVILLVTGWGSDAASSVIVFVGSSPSNPASITPAGRPAIILAGLAPAALIYRPWATRRHTTVPAAHPLLAQAPESPGGRTDEVSECADSDIISSCGTITAKYTGVCLAMLDRLICLRPPDIGASSARTRHYTIGAVVCGAVFLFVLGAVHAVASADSGIAGCTALSGKHQIAVPDYARIRSQFAGSRWPDLRVAGMSYVDLAVELQNARHTDGYETAWFYQRLSMACAGLGRNMTSDR